MSTITIYKTPTCATCNMAKKRLEAAGAEVTVIDLSEEPETLEALKIEMGVDVSSPIQVPIFRDQNGALGNIANLPSILAAVA